MSSADIEDPGHGNSPAAWVAVAIMLIAVVIGTIAFRYSITWLVWASASSRASRPPHRLGAQAGRLWSRRRQMTQKVH